MNENEQNNLALDGVSVLDLTFFAGGKWAAMTLGDLGADVVAIEMPRGIRPDDYKLMDDDTHARWFWYQRNKRSVTLNLKTDGGRAVFDRLVAKADVVVESFKPGTAKRLGVDYEQARDLNPAIIYCSISGFGQTGPYSGFVSHETNYEGLSGALGQNQINGVPHPLSAAVGNLGGGSSHALIAILSALIYKERTGKGQYIDVAITAGILPFLSLFPYSHWAGDDWPYSKARYSDGRPTFSAYETQDGKFVSISPLEPWLWKKFCSAVDREDLVAEFEPQTPEGRAKLATSLRDLFLSRTQAEWTELNFAENISVTPVWTTMAEVEADPQMIHRNMVVDLDYAPKGTIKQVGIPFIMSESPAQIRWMPQYGEHTEEVLLEAGYSQEDIEGFRSAGVCE